MCIFVPFSVGSINIHECWFLPSFEHNIRVILNKRNWEEHLERQIKCTRINNMMAIDGKQQLFVGME